MRGVASGPDDALRSAARARGLDPAGARLIHHYSNAVYHLPGDGLAVRITRGRDVGRRMRLVCRVVTWLVDEHDFPATAPARGLEPVDIDARTTASFWQYHAQPEHDAPLDSAQLGALLRRLHDITDPPPVQPDHWVALASLDGALADPATASVLRADDRSWLIEDIARTRDDLAALDWPRGLGLIHGDAWAGNLLWKSPAAERALFTDWDWVSIGPREVDLIPTWHAARRYDHGPRWTDAFVERYGYDLATWHGLPTLMHMRDLVQITGPLRRAGTSADHRRALSERIRTLRAGDTTNIWTAL